MHTRMLKPVIYTNRYLLNYTKQYTLIYYIRVHFLNDYRSSRTQRGKIATYLIVEYHHGRLQSTPLGKLCTDASG